MSTWQRLLFFIPSYRFAFDERDRQVEHSRELQGQNTVLREEVARLNEQLAESLRNERVCYQMAVNAASQSRWGMTPFPNAPSIPEAFQPKEGVLGSQFASGRDVERRERELAKERILMSMLPSEEVLK